MQNVQLTVLMATRDGQYVLPRTLDAYRRVAAPPVGWKMVVVDNGSTDATPAIIRSFEKDLPLVLLQQRLAGKNRALNTGLEAVEGRLVIFTDDDAIPSSSFLTAWAKFLNSREDYQLFGGSIEPLFEAPPPKWLLENRHYCAMMFAERDLDEGPTQPGEIYGPNMAARMSVLERGFRFNENVGPNALDANYPMGGESEFCLRVAQAGIGCWFAREPVVQHIVRPFQLTNAAWAKRAYRTGRGRAQIMWASERNAPSARPASLAQQPGRPWRRLLDALSQFEMLSPFPKQRFERRCAYHLARGFEDECAKRQSEG
jgi:GT2 family glycosyltransferase